MFIVELVPGAWYVPWAYPPRDCFPGCTMIRANARRYSRKQDAKAALTRARKHKSYSKAKIVEVD